MKWLDALLEWLDGRPTVCDRCGKEMVSKKNGRTVSGRFGTSPSTSSRKFGRCFDCMDRGR